MKRTTIIFLAVILISPVLIVSFLRMYGSNRFDVPVYYQDSLNVNCESVKLPYKIDKLLTLDAWGDSLTIVSLPHNHAIDQSDKIELLRLCEKLENRVVRWISLTTENEKTVTCTRQSVLPPFEIQSLEECVLLFPKDGSNAVLIDGAGRIRGYYNLTQRDETDRLAVEIDILIENEEQIIQKGSPL